MFVTIMCPALLLLLLFVCQALGECQDSSNIDVDCTSSNQTPTFQVEQSNNLSKQSNNQTIHLTLIPSNDCTNLTDSLYIAYHCPNVDPPLSLHSPVDVIWRFNQSLNGAVQVPITFLSSASSADQSFHLFGVVYDQLFISQHGVISFGISPSFSSSPELPLIDEEQDQLPIIAPWWTNSRINSDNPNTQIAYSSEIVDSQSVFVIRFRNAIDQSTNHYTTSWDILLYAGINGKIEIRFYDLYAPSSSTQVSTAVLSDDLVNNLILLNNIELTADVASSMTNTTLLMSYIGPDETNSPCIGLGYNLTDLTAVELTYEDSARMSRYSLRVCGVAETCSSDVSGKSMMCKQSWANGTVVNTSLSVWKPSAVLWSYPEGSDNGVQLIQEDGTFCEDIEKGRVVITRFSCDLAALTPIITHVNETRCIFNVNVSTSLVCGPGQRGTPPSVDIPQSSLTRCMNFAADFYDATLCPVYTGPPETLIRPTRLPTNETNFVRITAPFLIFMYGSIFNELLLFTDSGMIQLASTSNILAVGQRLPGEPFPGLPVISALQVRLYNADARDGVVPYTGFIAWSVLGSPPNRRLIVRFQDVDFWSSREVLISQRKVSFDIVITEGEPSMIEIRYYRIDPNAIDTVTIGISAAGNAIIIEKDAVFRNALAKRISGSYLRYRYSGVIRPDYCRGVAGAYNFSTLANHELNWTTNSYEYYYRPCSAVTTSKCRSSTSSSSSTICRVNSGSSGTSVSLASDAPSSTVWDVLDDNTVQVTYSSGAFCPGTSAPRQAVNLFQCDHSAVPPQILHLSENTTCLTYLVVASDLACLAPQNCALVQGNQYNIENCNVRYDEIGPVQLTRPTSVLVSPNQVDDSFAFVALPWKQLVYGRLSDNLWIGENGWISFGQSGANGLRNGPLPLPVNYQDALPLVAIFLTDLTHKTPALNSSIQWSIEGESPARYAVVRWTRMTTASSTLASAALFTFEARVHEGEQGLIEGIFYNMTRYENPVTMGIVSDDASTFTVSSNMQMQNQTSLTGTVHRYMYTGLDYSKVRTCGSLGYNFSTLMDTDLMLPDGQGRGLYFRPCGVVRDSVCAQQISTERSMVCTARGGIMTVVSNLAIYSPTGVRWSYLSNGVQMFSATGVFCTATNTPTITYVNFICNAAIPTAQITNMALASGCVYTITVETHLACSGGNRNSDSNQTRPVDSTLPGCVTTSGFFYRSLICPRSRDDSAYDPVQMTGPTRILNDTDNSVESIDIIFPFSFFGAQYRRLYVNTNGLLQFGETGVNTSATEPLSSMSAADNNWPIIAAFFSDLINMQSSPQVDYPGYIQYSNEGSIPNRQLIVRFTLVDYYNYRLYPGAAGVSFDVILSENTTDIVVRYYVVEANPTIYAVLGVRADSPEQTAYTAFVNHQLVTPLLASQLQGSTITYQYTGANATEACGAFGISLIQAIGSDLSWTDANSGRTYYHRVCGVVEAAPCVNTPATSVSTLCEASGLIGLYSAASFNPAAAVWERFTDGIGVTLVTGTFCATIGGPRITHIRYVCSPEALRPALIGVVVTNSCTYNTTVQTVAACFVPSQSSSSAASHSLSSIARSSSGTASSSNFMSSLPALSSSDGLHSSSGSPSSSLSSSGTSSFGSFSSLSIITSSARTTSSSSASSSDQRTLSSSSSSMSATSAISAADVSSSELATSSHTPASSSSMLPTSEHSSSSAMELTDNSSSSSSRLSDGAIAGIVIGVLLGVALFIALLVMLCFYGPRRQKAPEPLGDPTKRASEESMRSSQFQAQDPPSVVINDNIELSRV